MGRASRGTSFGPRIDRRTALGLIGGGLALGGSGLLTAGNTAFAAPLSTAASKTPVIALGGPGDTYTFNPITYHGSLGFEVCKLVYTPLILLDKNWKNMTPGLATSWAWSNNATTLTLKLRHGVTFHDGTPFTSKDVLFTLQLMTRRQLGPAIPDPTVIVGGADYRSGKSDTLPGVTAPDDYTVQIKLTGPSSDLLRNLSDTGILPAHAFASDVLDTTAPQTSISYWTDHPIGTGPFKVGDFDLTTHINLEAFPKYFKGAPKIKNMVINLALEGSAVVTALQDGSVDSAYVSAQQAAALLDSQTIGLQETYELATSQELIFAGEKDYLNKDVRQALFYALNIPEICKTVEYGLAKPKPATIMQPNLFPNPKLQSYKFNPKKAKALLKSGGWDFSRTLILGTFTAAGSPEDPAIPIMFNMWSAVGVNAKYLPMDSANEVAIFQATPHPYDVCYTNLAWTAYDASSFFQLFGCESTTGNANDYAYCNPDFDSAMQAAIHAPNQAEAIKNYRTAQTILQDDLPALPLWMTADIWAINKNFKGGNLARGPLNDIGAEKWTISSKS